MLVKEKRLPVPPPIKVSKKKKTLFGIIAGTSCLGTLVFILIALLLIAAVVIAVPVIMMMIIENGVFKIGG